MSIHHVTCTSSSSLDWRLQQKCAMPRLDTSRRTVAGWHHQARQLAFGEWWMCFKRWLNHIKTIAKTIAKTIEKVIGCVLMTGILWFSMVLYVFFFLIWFYMADIVQLAKCSWFFGANGQVERNHIRMYLPLPLLCCLNFHMCLTLLRPGFV